MGLTRIRAQQISDLDYKQAVRVVTTDNITLVGGAPATVDGVNLQVNDRILVTGQDLGRENGIYRVQTLGLGETGTWTRTTDANETGEIQPGMVVMVTEGESYADTPWKLVTNGNIIIGETALTFQQFATGGSGTPGGSNTQIQYNNAGSFGASANLTWNGAELYVNGDGNITGNVTAAYFIGDGSLLTGISASGNSISSGNSNVDIATANGNITMSVSGISNVIVISTDGVTVTGNIVGNGIPTTTVSNVAPVGPEQGDVWIDSDSGIQYIYFSDGDSAQWAEMEALVSISTVGGTGNVDLSAVAQSIVPAANITYDLGNATHRWRDLYLSGNTIDLGGTQISADGGNLILPATVQIGNVTLEDSGGNLILPSSIQIGNVTLSDTDGNLSLPENITAVTVSVSGNITGGNLTVTGVMEATGNITGGNLTPTNALAVIHGGTGATTAANALSNLGAASIGKAIAMTIVFG